jgi:hypothetical protein
MSGTLHTIPRRHAATLWPAWFGIAGGPLAWFAQLVVGYGLWARRCYPGDVPIVWPSSSGVAATLAAVDVLAIMIAVAGFIVSWRISQGTPDETRARFLSSWGMLSSACFLIAILSATVMSVGMPSCE